MLTPTKKKLVNRRSSDYHGSKGKRIMGLKEWDKDASYLLATSYSRRSGSSHKSQSLIQMDCVAVAWVGNTLFAASNSKKLESSDFDALADALGYSFTYANIKRGSGGMHAEMQVYEELAICYDELSKIVTYIGVSKPCCKQCATFLTTQGMTYAQWHDAKVVNWEAPSPPTKGKT